MKLSVSLSDLDVAFLDQYARQHEVDSRSAVVQRAVVLLRASELGEDYAAAWEEWEPEAEVWESTVADGLRSSESND